MKLLSGGFVAVCALFAIETAGANDCAEVQALLAQGFSVNEVANGTGLNLGFVDACRRAAQGFRVPNSARWGAGGPPPVNAMGPPPSNPMGRPPTNPMGRPPLNPMGKPPTNPMGGGASKID